MDIQIEGDNVIVTTTQIIPKAQLLEQNEVALKNLQEQLANLQGQIIKIEETIALLKA